MLGMNMEVLMTGTMEDHMIRVLELAVIGRKADLSLDLVRGLVSIAGIMTNQRAARGPDESLILDTICITVCQRRRAGDKISRESGIVILWIAAIRSPDRSASMDNRVAKNPRTTRR